MHPHAEGQASCRAPGFDRGERAVPDALSPFDLGGHGHAPWLEGEVRLELGHGLAAMRLARDLGPGKTVVTILADGGQRYQSKLFNPVFLREKSLPLPPWMT